MKVFALFLGLLTSTSLWAHEHLEAVVPVEAPVADVSEDDGVRVAVLGYHDFSETESETAMRIRTSKWTGSVLESLNQV